MSSRVSAVVGGVCAVLLVATLLFPWWTISTGVEGGSTSKRVYGPFHRSFASGDEFRLPTIILGSTIISAAFVAAGSAIVAGMGGRAAWPWLVVLVLVAGALAYVAFVFPQEATKNFESGSFSFFGKTCEPEGNLQVCRSTAPGLGWWGGVVALPFPLAAILALPRTTRAPKAGKAPAAAPALKPAPHNPNPFSRALQNAGPAVTARRKCPRCHTWLSYARREGATTIECHNCRHRFEV